MTLYSKSQVTEISAKAEDGSVTILISTLMESAFSLAGLKLREEDGVRVVSPVRCRIGRTCEVDLERVSSEGPGGPYAFVVEGEGPVSVEYSGGETEALIDG